MSDHRRGFLAVLLVSVVALVACDDSSPDGDDDGGSAPSAGATTTTSPLSSLPAGTADGGAVAPEGFSLVTIVVVDADGDEHVLCVWLADTAAERQRGLMGVTDLGGADGMLFVYGDPTDSNFWMFGTPMPLSIAFFDEGGTFVSAADMTPCIDTPTDECRRYPAGARYTHALEVPRGELDGLGVTEASHLQLVSKEIDACPAA
jgi:uncharacterized membrane protein (UPF0127 family)